MYKYTNKSPTFFIKTIFICTVLFFTTGWVWPWDNYTESEKEQISYFKESHRLFIEASRMQNKIFASNDGAPISTVLVSDKDLQSYVKTLDSAYNNANKVSLSVLAKIHPELPKAYIDIYLTSLKNQSDSIKESNPEKSILGSELHDLWIDWFNTHYNDFKLR